MQDGQTSIGGSTSITRTVWWQVAIIERTVPSREMERATRTPRPTRRGRPTPGAEPSTSETATIVEPRPRPADGPENPRWPEVLAERGTILDDGAMGTMLFAAGLQFGDPPEAWNVAHPEVVRRIHRGYPDARSRLTVV